MDSATERVRAWAAQAQHRADAARTMADEVASICATARDASGAVVVTVDATGAMVDLRLGDAVRALSPAQLADEIMATVSIAHGDVLARISSLVGSTVGFDSPAGVAVLGGLERRGARWPGAHRSADA